MTHMTASDIANLYELGIITMQEARKLIKRIDSAAAFLDVGDSNE